MVNTVRLVSSLSRVQGFELANAADCLINTLLQRGAYRAEKVPTALAVSWVALARNC